MEFSDTHPKPDEVLTHVSRESCGCLSEHYSGGAEVVTICRGHGYRVFVVPPVRDLPGMEHLANI